jgi:hypothetical protein
MRSAFRTITAAAIGTALALTGLGAMAAVPAQLVTASSSFGVLAVPYTNGFGQPVPTLPSPYTTDDYFVSDHGFSLQSNASFSSAVVTFDLGSTLQLSDLSMSLLRGSPWTGSLPGLLSPADIANRLANTVAASTGSATMQQIDPLLLAAGDYVLEIRGRVTGSAGGSYGGVINVAAVPEPSGAVLALLGLSLLAVVGRRARR